MSKHRTVGDLLRAVRPKGDVYVWTPLSFTSTGEPSQRKLRLHKTDFIAMLRRMDQNASAVPFAIQEWNYKSGTRWRRARAIYLNDYDGDHFERRVDQVTGEPL